MLHRFLVLLAFLTTLGLTRVSYAQAQPAPEPAPDGASFGGTGAAMLVGSILLQTGIGSAHILSLMFWDSDIVCGGWGGCPTSPSKGAPYLLVPIAGPFLAMEKMDAVEGRAVLLAATGVAQIAGLATLLAGVAYRAIDDEEPSVVLAPIVAPDSLGASLGGAF